MNIKKILAKNYHWLILAMFLGVHALTCAFTTYYGDDYYYAAFVKNGAGYFLDENIFHYNFTNGRVLVHLLDELMIGWSFWVWRAANVVVAALLVVVVAKLASRAYRVDIQVRMNEYRLAVVAACAVFCITDVAVLRQGVYWATGSLNYLFPVTATLWFYYYFRRDFERFRGSRMLVVAAFFASVTTEQASAAALLVTLCFIVSSYVVKRMAPRPAYLGAFAASLLGFCTLLFAPGNAERIKYYPEFYELTFFGKINKNFRELSSVVFGRGGIYPIICVAFVLIILICMKNYIHPTISRRKRILATLLAGITASALGFYIWGLSTDSSILELPWMGFLIAVPLLSAMAWTAAQYFKRGEIDNFYFVWCAVSMQGAMLISPEYGPRTLLISIAALAVPVVRLIVENRTSVLFAVISVVVFALLPWYIRSPGLFALVLISVASAASLLVSLYGTPSASKLTACFALALCFAQFTSVANGYHINVAVNEMNLRQVEDYLVTDRTGPLVIYYLPSEEYRYTMPYDNMYHQHVFLKMYGIAADIFVAYEFPPLE